MSDPAKRLLHSLSKAELHAALDALKLPRFRTDQLWRWLYVQHVDQWDAMTNIPRSAREKLAGKFELGAVRASRTETSSENTRKILAQLRDGDAVEEVLIPAGTRRTVCVSTQVGCRFHCSFCASGQAGFRRQLEAGEIVGQVLLAARAWEDRPTHVVYMGIGEPMDNYDNVMRSVRIINDGDGLAIGARRITISTCGLVPGIQRLAKEDIQVELSVSLHAPDDDLRAELMPVNRTFPIRVLLDTCAEYTRATRRLITFEYTLIHGVNDSPAQAARLADLLRPFPCRVNLIPLSGVTEFGAAPAGDQQAARFVQTLAAAGTNATLRTSRGSTVKAACGQLRFRTEAPEEGTT